MDFLNTGLAVSSALCGVGVLRRFTARYRRTSPESSPPAGHDAPGSRSFRSLLSGLKTFILEVLLLSRTGRTSRYRLFMHSLIFIGFMGLLLFHAMDTTVTARFFPEYEPTLDPWQFLRNLFGLMVLAGTAMAAARRFRNPRLHALTRFQDWALLLLVGSIVVSGFVLEAVKIVSEPVFDRMADEYFYADDPEDTAALKLFWAEEYGVVFRTRPAGNPERRRLGAELDEENCAACHSNTASAFVSRPMAAVLSPAANILNFGRADEFFWYLHVVLCFMGLAFLPYAKFFHPVTTPLNLLHRRGRHDSEAGTAAPSAASSAFLAGPGFDACTRCGECSLHCSVRPIFDVLGNPDILPSEKLMDLKDHVSDTPLAGPALSALAEGSRLCTGCLRCTDICPSGIDLQALWRAVEFRALSPNDVVRSLSHAQLTVMFEDTSSAHLSEHLGIREGMGLADRSDSFQACVQCTTCTSVCPVVAVSDDPTRDLDLTPQQIMNMLRMGLKDRTLGARMVWSCTTCGKCREHCPQGIPVADILYELRNTAGARLRARQRAGLPVPPVSPVSPVLPESTGGGKA